MCFLKGSNEALDRTLAPMAVSPSPNSKATVSDQLEEKKNKRKMINGSGEEDIKSPKKSDDAIAQPSKRNKCPGVRVVHGRIYDSANGKTCHQCRQKTLDFSADCKNGSRNKPCTLKYCHTCLLNRYGEKAERVVSLEDWNCPRCRGICNCSICMKKRGHQPTGMLVQMAKASGFSSVSDLLLVKGASNVSNYRGAKETGASTRKQAAQEEGTMTASPRKLGKENVYDGKTDLNKKPPPSVPSPVEEKPKNMKQKGSLDSKQIPPPPVPSPVEEKQKNMKRKGSSVMLDGSGPYNVSVIKTTSAPSKNQKNSKPEVLSGTDKSDLNGGSQEETVYHSGKKKPKKMKIAESNEVLEDNMDGGANTKEVGPTKSQISKISPTHGKTNENVDCLQQDETAFKKFIDKKDEDEEKNKVVKVLVRSRIQNTNQHVESKKSYDVCKDNRDLHNKSLHAVVPLPTGSELVTVAGVDLPKEDVGSVLQFLEFCATFGKILDVKKGQAEVVIRELIKGRSARRGKYSVIIQFYIQLLSVIQEELGSESPTLDPTHGSNSWLKALKSYIPESHRLLCPLDSLDRDAGRYDNLDLSTKLRLLNLLCDEVLGTKKIRNFIDDQNFQFAEKRKEAKERLMAAKDKEKCLKQKMQDDIAKALIARNGAPLTISEHEAVVSRIKMEAAQAHAEMLESKRMVPKDKGPDAIRTEAIFRDTNGHVYWRLKGYSEKSDILCLDTGNGDDRVESGEKWFRFDAEQIDVIQRHYSALREGRRQPRISC